MKIQTTEFVAACGRPEEFPHDGTQEVAFAGRSNVGKSSLLNRIVGRDLARTSRTPGRTQTINWFRVDRRWWLVDLPGYGYAKASRTARESWARLIASYFEVEQERRLVVQLVDGKVGTTPLDVEAAGYFEDLGVTRLVVATKIDRLRRNEVARRRSEIAAALNLTTEAELLAVSAKTGEGIRELWKRIAGFLAQ